MSTMTASKSGKAVSGKLNTASPFRIVKMDAGKHIIIHKKGDDKAAGLLADKIMEEAEKRTTGVSSRKLLTEMRNKRG